MSTNSTADRLLEESNSFSVDLMERLSRIVPSGDLGLTCDAAIRKNGEALIAISSANSGGIVLTIDNEDRLQLQIDYKLIMSPNSLQATVYTSSFLVRPFGVSRPLFTVDYVRDAGVTIPAAHYNFHFQHDDLVAELMECGKAHRGKHRHKALAAGVSPRLADLHFPIGGHRFRLCIEDVLDGLRLEFGIDVLPTAARAIGEGRAAWREFQLRAAVSDDPKTAVKELQKLGYEVSWSGSESAPSSRMERISAI